MDQVYLLHHAANGCFARNFDTVKLADLFLIPQRLIHTYSAVIRIFLVLIMNFQHSVSKRLILPWGVLTSKIVVKRLPADFQNFAVKVDFSDVFAVIGSACDISQSLLFPDFRRHAAKKAAESSKNSFILLSRLFSFSNAFIRFLSCWFSSAIFRDSSGLCSPQPISRLPIYTFLIQPYSVFTGI